MMKKSIFNVKFTMSFLMAVLFTAALVAAGCSSSDKDEKAEEAEVTESVEVKEAPAEAEPEERRPTGPPQELIDACNDLNAGDDCSLTLPADTQRGGGEVEYVGTCMKIRTGDMACMPRPRPGKTKWKTPAPEPAEDSDQEAGEAN